MRAGYGVGDERVGDGVATTIGQLKGLDAAAPAFKRHHGRFKFQRMPSLEMYTFK